MLLKVEVQVELAKGATRGSLPSELRYLQYAHKMAFVVISSIDDGGDVHEEWRQARLVFLSKKGGAFRFAKIGVVFVF